MERILVLGPNKPFLGAQIVQLPFLSEVRARHPDAFISLAVPFSGASIFEEYGFQDEVVGGWGESSAATIQFVNRAMRLRPDLVYSLRAHSGRAGLVALLSGSHLRVAFNVRRNRLFFNRVVAPRDDVYLALKYLDLVEVGRAWKQVPQLLLWTPETERRVDAMLAERKILPRRVALILGAGEKTKQWPVPKFVELASGIRDRAPDIEVLFFLSPDEASGPLGSAIAGLEPGLKFVLETPMSLACALSKCSLLISSDCGPAHFGHLLGLSQVVLFGGAGRPHEWFLPRPGATSLMSQSFGSVSNIEVGEVLEAAFKITRSG